MKFSKLLILCFLVLILTFIVSCGEKTVDINIDSTPDIDVSGENADIPKDNLTEEEISEDAEGALQEDGIITEESEDAENIKLETFTAYFGETPTYEQWCAIGLSDVSSFSYDIICALVTGDIDRFTDLCGVLPEVYESWRDVQFGSYTISCEEIAAEDDPEATLFFPVLEIEVLESDDAFFTPGTHRLVFEEGYAITFTHYDEYKWYTFYDGDSMSSCEKYINQLGFNRTFLPVLAEDDRMVFVCDFIVARLNTLSGDFSPVSAEQIYEYAEKYLDIERERLDLDRYLFAESGGYVRIGKGGSTPVSTYISEEERNGVIVATIQYWADYSKSVRSQKAEVYLELIDGEYRYIKTEIVEDTGYATEYYSL